MVPNGHEFGGKHYSIHHGQPTGFPDGTSEQCERSRGIKDDSQVSSLNNWKQGVSIYRGGRIVGGTVCGGGSVGFPSGHNEVRPSKGLILIPSGDVKSANRCNS